MKAKNISGQAPGGKRTVLAEVLPLDTPILVQIFPIYACNFTCKYCVFSIPRNKRSFISDKIVMDFDLFKKCIDELAVFPSKAKTLRFVGMGEPLLHKKIAAMVKYAVLKDVANKVEILTNGSLLTPKLSDALISADLSRLVISIQGTTAKKYQEISKVNIDFEKFVKNIKYFFDYKDKTKVHIKIVDIALDDKNDEKRFYEIFEDVCDTIGIEHASPIFPGVKYNRVLKDSSFTQFGLKVSEIQVCPQPFFTLQINPDGKVVPCYSVTYPAIMGDCNKQSLSEIWNGKKYQQFRRKMLDGAKNVCKLCANCKIIKHRLFPEDILDNDAERLKKFYES